MKMQWISVNDKLPKFYCIVEIKKKNGEECKAYFHSDRMSWLNFYGIKTSYFQHDDGTWLHDVSHWRKFKTISSTN